MPWREITYDREKLFVEVWEEPVLTVAKRYGISNVGHAKICRRLAVRFHRGVTMRRARSRTAESGKGNSLPAKPLFTNRRYLIASRKLFSQ